MLPLVRVGAAVSADVVTSTKLFVMRYNITSLASVHLLARDTQFKLSSMVVSTQRAKLRCSDVVSTSVPTSIQRRNHGYYESGIDVVCQRFFDVE